MNLLSAPTTANGERLNSNISSNRSSNISVGNEANMDEKELAKKRKRDE